MTAIAAKLPAGLVAGAEHEDGRLIGRLRRAWARQMAYRATLTELGALSESQLGDLGFTRATLRQTARRAVDGI